MLQLIKIEDYITTQVNQKFSNILVQANLQCVYHVTKEVQAIKSTSSNW